MLQKGSFYYAKIIYVWNNMADTKFEVTKPKGNSEEAI
jgi:hypothetical protein